MNFLRRLSRFIAPERRTVIGSIVAGLVFAGSGLIPPLLIRQILLWHADGPSAENAIGIIVIRMLIISISRIGSIVSDIIINMQHPPAVSQPQPAS